MNKRTGDLAQLIETSQTLDDIFKKKRSRLSDDLETSQEGTHQEVCEFISAWAVGISIVMALHSNESSAALYRSYNYAQGVI